MGPFFKKLFTDETAFARFAKAVFSGSAIVLTGAATFMTSQHAQIAIVTSGALAAISGFIPTGDKTPENVKQLAKDVDSGVVSVVKP